MKINLQATPEERAVITRELIRSSLWLSSMDASDYRQSTFVSLNPNLHEAETVPSDGVVFKAKLPMKSSIPGQPIRNFNVYGGMVRGERGGNFWTNFAIDGQFEPQPRYSNSALSFVSQVLLDAIPRNGIPRVSLFEDYVAQRLSQLGASDERTKKGGLYCPYLESHFNSDRFKAKFAENGGDVNFIDDGISNLTKGYAYCLLSDLLTPGNLDLTAEQSEFFKTKYATLLKLSNIWEDIGVTRSSYSALLTTNKLMGSLKTAMYLHGIDVGDPIKISSAYEAVSLNETDAEGKEWRDLDSAVAEATKGIGTIEKDQDMAASNFLANALLITKSICSSTVEKTVPTVFPGLKLNITPEGLKGLVGEMPDEFKDATWISYEGTEQLVSGQYHVKSTKYKYAGKMLSGTAKWNDNRMLRYVLTVGNDTEVSGRLLLNGDQMALVRRYLHPTFKYQEQEYRYMGCSTRGSKREDFTYNWLEVDKNGKPVSLQVFDRDQHQTIRDANPELMGHNPRGLHTLVSDLEKAVEKQRKFSPALDTYITAMEGIAGEDNNPALSMVADTVLANFHDTLMNTSVESSKVISENVVNILHRAYNNLVAPCDTGKVNVARLQELDTGIEQQLLDNYTNMLYTHAMVSKFGEISKVLAEPQAPANVGAISKGEEVLRKELKAHSPRATALVDAFNQLQNSAQNFGIVLGPDQTLRNNIRNTETLQLKEASVVRKFRMAVNDFYGDKLMDEITIPVFDDNKRISQQLSLNAAAKALTKGSMSNIHRELNVLTTIAEGKPLSNGEISVAEAAKILPNNLLESHLNMRASYAMHSFDYTKGKSVIPYNPFIMFGQSTNFKEVCNTTQAACLRDINALHKFMPKAILREPAGNDPANKGVAGFEKSAFNPLEPEAVEKLQALVHGLEQDDSSLKSICRDVLVAVCNEVGKTQDGIAANTQLLSSEFDRDGDSYAASTGVKLARELGDPNAVFAALKKSGVYDSILESCKERVRESKAMEHEEFEMDM